MIKKTKKQSFWTHDEFLGFINSVRIPEHKLLFSLLFYYGLRIGELRGLKHQDIDLEHELVFIERSITNKTLNKGQVVSTLKTSSSLREYPLLKQIKSFYIPLDKPHNLDEYIFKSSKEGSLVIGETSVRKYFDEYTISSKLKRITFHDFRRSSNIYLKSLGFDMFDRASWLGHSNPNVTNTHYTPTEENLKNKIKEKIDSKK